MAVLPLLFVAFAAVLGLGLLFRRRKARTLEIDAQKLNSQLAVETESTDVSSVSKSSLLILYGSQTGNAENFARQLAEEAKRRKHKVRVQGLQDVKPFESLGQETAYVIIVTSTFGEGEPPDNAVDWWKWLSDSSRPGDLFASVRFTIFGLGNRQYEHYQAMGRGMNKHMERLGACRFCDIGEGDDDGSLEEDFLKWKEKLWTAIEDLEKLHESADSASETNRAAAEPSDHLNGHSHVPSERAFRVVIHPPGTQVESSYDATSPWSTTHAPLSKDSHGAHSHGAVRARMLENRELHSAASDRSCRHIEFDLTGTGLTYEAGDHLGVYPENSPDLVRAYAQRLSVEPDTVFSLESLDHSDGSTPFSQPMTVFTALQRFCDLTTPPRKALLKALADYATDAAERERLASLASSSPDGKADYSKFVIADQRTPLCILHEFPSLRVPFDHLLELLPRLQPRYYSISSSPKKHPDRVHITVALVHFSTPAGRRHDGVCTSFLASLGPGSHAFTTGVPVFVRRSNFKLPARPGPVIMVGPGTGLAPFRGFTFELCALRNAGEVEWSGHLFFGCRRRDVDYIYTNELEAFVADGTLNTLHVAFSREAEDKCYVQHKLHEQRDLVWRLLSEQQASFYVCGDARAMAKDVNKMLHLIAEEAGGKSPEDAKAFVKELQQSGRYLQDVWF